MNYESKLLEENLKYKAQLKVSTGYAVTMTRLSVCRVESGYSLQSTTWLETFDFKEASNVQRQYPCAKIVPIKKLLKERIARNEKILKTIN